MIELIEKIYQKINNFDPSTYSSEKLINKFRKKTLLPEKQERLTFDYVLYTIDPNINSLDQTSTKKILWEFYQKKDIQFQDLIVALSNSVNIPRSLILEVLIYYFQRLNIIKEHLQKLQHQISFCQEYIIYKILLTIFGGITYLFLNLSVLDIQTNYLKWMKLIFLYGSSYLIDDLYDLNIIKKNDLEIIRDLCLERETQNKINQIKNTKQYPIIKVVLDNFQEFRNLTDDYKNKKELNQILINLFDTLENDINEDNKNDDVVDECIEKKIKDTITKSSLSRMVFSYLFDQKLSEEKINSYLLNGLFFQLTDDLLDFEEDLEQNPDGLLPMVYRHQKINLVLTLMENNFLLLCLENPLLENALVLAFHQFSLKINQNNIIKFESTLASRNQKQNQNCKLFLDKLLETKNWSSKNKILIPTSDLKEQYLNQISFLDKQYKKHLQEIKNLTTINNNNNNPIINGINYIQGGKTYRSFLSRIFGLYFKLTPEELEPIFKTIEFAQNASLIMDDLPAQDNGKLRRGKPCLHLAKSEPLAHLTIVTLIVESFRSLSEYDDLTMVRKLVNFSSEMMGYNGLSLGQYYDLHPQEEELSIESYLKQITYKTAYGFIYPIKSVGIISYQSNQILEKLHQVGYLLGICYQIKDDLNEQFGEQDNLENKESNRLSPSLDSEELNKLYKKYQGKLYHILIEDFSDFNLISLLTKIIQ